MTWNPSGYTLFINGDIFLQQQNSGVPGNDIGRFFIGHNLDRNQTGGGWRSFLGYIGDIRWSDTVKYSSNFTPDPDLQVESDTLLLFKLDEEIGSTVYDVSGNAPDGTINGAIWDVIECRE